jgi:hypothetical protein
MPWIQCFGGGPWGVPFRAPGRVSTPRRRPGSLTWSLAVDPAPGEPSGLGRLGESRPGLQSSSPPSLAGSGHRAGVSAKARDRWPGSISYNNLFNRSDLSHKTPMLGIICNLCGTILVSFTLSWDSYCFPPWHEGLGLGHGTTLLDGYCVTCTPKSGRARAVPSQGKAGAGQGRPGQARAGQGGSRAGQARASQGTPGCPGPDVPLPLM